ncbi:MAG: response regulator [Armatimonadetes bacterium]|nr:response regulator [Armatimonadota bacterium]
MAKILAVDDMEDIVRLVQINLQRKGHQVLTAYDGEEALHKVREELPDLVISDVTMPKKDGITLLRELREDEMTRGIPFILLTVKAQDTDIWEGYESGADAYLKKPFNPTELLETVDRVLEEKNSSPAPD